MNLYFLLAKQYIILYCPEVLVSIVSKFKQRSRRKEAGTDQKDQECPSGQKAIRDNHKSPRRYGPNVVNRTDQKQRGEKSSRC